MKVAFLGLGIMGSRMAANLVKAGHQVTVWNRTAGKSTDGALLAATPAEAARDAEVVWMCVADTAAVERVLFGENGVSSALKPGMIVVDSSTINPLATREIANRIRALGADFVDAPVTGSKVGAETGQLVFIVGGEKESLERLSPLFSAMGKQVIHIGETGLGESAKIGMNLMIAMIYQGFAEALTLTNRLGVPMDKFIELVQASMVRSGVTDYKAPFIQKRDFTPNFPLRLMHKDIHLMLEAAAASGVCLPALSSVEKIYSESSELRDQDYAATLVTVENLSRSK